MSNFDLILHGGSVIDGTGSERRLADVGIRGDRITTLGRLDPGSAREAIDVSGRVVAPGFVDVHNHSDGWLLKDPHLRAKVSQGFTTEILMADGISYAPVSPDTATEWIFYLRSINGLQIEDYSGWRTIAEYMNQLDGSTSQNAIAHVPYANVRTLAMGWRRGLPDDAEMGMIQAEIQRGMEEGAVGLSTGLDYVAQCFSDTDELVEACKAIAPYGGVYVTHVRYKKGVIEGVEEAVQIGKRAGVAVHISHLKATTPELTEQLLETIDRSAREVDFSFDVYPYLPGSTMIHFLLPYDVWEAGPLGVVPKLRDPGVRRRFAAMLDVLGIDAERIFIAWVATKDNACYQGRTIADYAEQLGKTPADAICDLLIEENLAVLAVVRVAGKEPSDDAMTDAFLAHPKGMLGSDGIYFPDSVVHPRVYGSAPRVLGPLVRDRGVFSLEEAVYKVSTFAAERFGLKDRGVIREGAFADLVVFDPDTICDTATYDDPHQTPVGIDTVIVNGVPVQRDGEPVSAESDTLPGRALLYERS